MKTITTAAAVEAAARELMTLTLCGNRPEDKPHQDGFRHQWDRGGFPTTQMDGWRERATLILQAADTAQQED